ncbi:hypothetical protein ONS95_011996 [Cadophora gregata]|uniref:uncharacterized protein n=1 Tax=Cadophora gregata TaxID=51156 RepID=UPI0026DC169E|nr:uncharacterized protein ONS95_011996 [Cadophora gregata]KAK0117667.1 hypothetical protein ONS95_011996 [Cadophora gregata]
MISTRVVTLTRIFGPADPVWGIDLQVEPPNSNWGRDDIDRWVTEGWNSVPNKSDVFLIAALWIPGYGYTMSSSPNAYKASRDILIHNGEALAPAWSQKVEERENASGADPGFHAEDGACFLYEKSLQKKLGAIDTYPSTATNKPYMVVYGRRWVGAAPGFVATCAKGKKGGSQLNPDCSWVMSELGIDVKL